MLCRSRTPITRQMIRRKGGVAPEDRQRSARGATRRSGSTDGSAGPLVGLWRGRDDDREGPLHPATRHLGLVRRGRAARAGDDQGTSDEHLHCNGALRFQRRRLVNSTPAQQDLNRVLARRGFDSIGRYAYARRVRACAVAPPVLGVSAKCASARSGSAVTSAIERRAFRSDRRSPAGLRGSTATSLATDESPPEGMIPARIRRRTSSSRLYRCPAARTAVIAERIAMVAVGAATQSIFRSHSEHDRGSRPPTPRQSATISECATGPHAAPPFEHFVPKSLVTGL